MFLLTGCELRERVLRSLTMFSLTDFARVWFRSVDGQWFAVMMRLLLILLVVIIEDHSFCFQAFRGISLSVVWMCACLARFLVQYLPRGSCGGELESSCMCACAARESMGRRPQKGLYYLCWAELYIYVF